MGVPAYDTMPDLGLQDEAEVTQAIWEAYDGWETQDASQLPDGVEQTNFASPKPDWSVLVNHLEPAKGWQRQQEQSGT